MNLPSWPIKEFPQDGLSYHLDWHGPVSLNAPDVQLSILLSPIEEGRNKAAGRILHEKRMLLGGLDVGLLPILRLGSIWKNGRCEERYQHETRALSCVGIGPEAVQLVASGSKIEETFLIPPWCLELLPFGFDSDCVVVKRGDDPFSVIIPVIELIRFYYCSSTQMARSLFFGRIAELSNLINTNESHYSDEFTFVKIRKEFADEEVPTIARIAHSPVARREARRINESLARQRAGHEAQGRPECGFPFEGDAHLKVRGKGFKSGGHQRFLVFEILECGGPFPFKALEWSRDNDGVSDGVEDVDRPIAFPGRKKHIDRGDGDGREGKIRSDKPPSADVLTTKAILSSGRFSDLSRITIRKRPKDQCLYRSGKQKSFVDDSHPDLGTGVPGYGESPSRPLNLVGTDPKKKRAKPMPVCFDSLRNVLIELEKLGSDGKLEWSQNIAPETGFTLGSLGAWEFPHRIDGNKKKWLNIVHPEPKHFRTAMVIRVRYKERSFTLLEVEAGISERSQKPRNYTLLALHAPDFGEIPVSVIEEILLNFARKPGKWGNLEQLRYFLGRPFKHTSATPESFAAKVFSFIVEA